MDLNGNATKTVAHILESWLGNEYDDMPVPQFLSPVGSESADFDEGRLIGLVSIRMAVRIADAILSLIGEERRARVCGDNLHAERLAEERAEAFEARCAKLEEALREYGCHYPECLLAQWHEGRPTKDGGYESRYGDKWYQGKDKPACTCGLHAALEALYDKITDWFDVEDWTDPRKGITEVEAHFNALDKGMEAHAKMYDRLAACEAECDRLRERLAEARWLIRNASVEMNGAGEMDYRKRRDAWLKEET